MFAFWVVDLAQKSLNQAFTPKFKCCLLSPSPKMCNVSVPCCWKSREFTGIKEKEKALRLYQESVSTAWKITLLILAVPTELFTHGTEKLGNFSVHLSKHLQFKAGEALKKYWTVGDHFSSLCGCSVCNRWGQGLGFILGISSVLMLLRKEIDFARLKKQPWLLVLWEG